MKKNNTVIILNLILIFFFSLNFAYSDCIDNEKLYQVEFSLSDNSFLFEFNGTKGIIQRITLNETTGNYSLWQTPLLNFTTSKGAIYEYSGTTSFIRDNAFTSNLTKMLIINNVNNSKISIYAKISIKNIGSCEEVGTAYIKNQNNIISHYGINNPSAQINPENRSSEWVFRGYGYETIGTNISETNATNLRNYGKLRINVGPEPYQRIYAYFWIENPAIICGDGFYDYGETCEPGLHGAISCNPTCSNRISVCGNGVVETGLYTFISLNPTIPKFNWIGYNRSLTNLVTLPAEVCDTALNVPNLYNCSSTCQIRYSKCGNGILENNYTLYNGFTGIDVSTHQYQNRTFTPQEFCDDGGNLNGDGCSSTCQLETYCGDYICNGAETRTFGPNYCPSDCFTAPTIKWENYQNLWQGNNLTPGQTFVLNYSITNNDPSNKTVRLGTYFRPIFLNQLHPTASWRWFPNGTISYGTYFYHPTPSYSLAGYSTIYVNKTIIIPNMNQSDLIAIDRMRFNEEFYYIQQNRPGYNAVFVYNTTNYWRDSSTNSTLSYYYGKQGGFGRFNRQVCVNNLKPIDESFTITTNSDGIPSVLIDYKNGYLRTTWEDNVSEDTLYLKTKLNLKDTTTGQITTYIEKNESLNQNFKLLNGYPIHPTGTEAIIYNKPELKVEKRIIFPLYDYNLINEKEAQFSVLFYDTATNTYCINPSNIENSTFRKIKLYTLFTEVDTPIDIYPKGGGGFSEKYTRVVLFNYQDFSLMNVSLTHEVKKEGLNSNDLILEYETSPILPAESSYPISMKVKYVGASPITDTLYIVKLTIRYIDPNTYEQKTDTLIVPVTIKSLSISGSLKFKDVLPTKMNYEILNLNNNTNLNVTIVNQGTENSGNFNVSFYVKKVNDTDFTLIGKNSISSLSPGTSTITGFDFTPSYLGKFVMKIVVDEENEIYEENNFIRSEENNILTSIAISRDIDVILEYIVPLYENASNGIIPFKVFARNKGTGGIDNYELKMTLHWEDYIYNESFFFYQIPEEGIEKYFFWNVTNVEPHQYVGKFNLHAKFDPYLGDNQKMAGVVFCPLPWYSTVFDCYTYCDTTCLDINRNRYDLQCRGVNGCNYYNDEFAFSCQGYLKDSYTTLNQTHEAMCPNGEDIRLTRFTSEELIINHTKNCNGILTKKLPGLYQGESVLVNVVSCIK